MEILAVIAGLALGALVATQADYYFKVRPLMQEIATMRREGYIGTIPVPERPPTNEPWLDIAEG